MRRSWCGCWRFAEAACHTVVTRDNTGRIRVFFDHVCGRPQAFGDSREEVYTALIDPPFPMKEIPPDQQQDAESTDGIRKP